MIFPCAHKSNQIVHFHHILTAIFASLTGLLMYLIDQLSGSIFIQSVQGILAVNVENFNKTLC